MCLRFLLISTVTLVSVFYSTCAFARLSGSLEWDYTQYNAKQDGVKVADQSSFAQRYTLMLEKQGLLMNGRGGRYDLALGGEWFSVDIDQKNLGANSNVKLDRAKMLYRGELIFSPAGLPFYFRAYGRDMHETQFLDNTPVGSFDEFYLSGPRASVLTPGIYTDVNDGNHFEYGASLTVGIKNGSYLGRYRNILSSFPKLYVDYRETQVRDLTSLSPENFVNRELAFVSLNKKHNWFHYRFFEHKDKIDPAQDYTDSIYLLGTVDQNMRREWVNLTNWIQLSADGSYAVEENPRNTQADEKKYALNLFAKTYRSNWRSNVLSRFWRHETLGELERYLEVPLFAEGNVNRDNAWRLRLIGSRDLTHRPFVVGATETTEDRAFSSFRWETNRSTAYVLSPEMAVESKFGDFGEGGAVRTGLEYYSNRDKKPAYDLFSAISLAYFWGSPETLPLTPRRDTDLLEIVGRYDLAKNLTPRTRVGVESLLSLATGTQDASVTDYITPVTVSSFAASQSSMINSSIDGTVWRGKGLLFFSHKGINRLNNRLEAGVDHLSGTDSQTQFVFRHRLDKDAAIYSFSSASELLYGDSLSANVTSGVFGASLTSGDFDGMSFSNATVLRMTPNRNNYMQITGEFDWLDPDAGDSSNRIALTEEYRYTGFQRSGLVRRLYELSQYLDFERFDPPGARLYQAVALTALVDYFPTFWSRLGTKVRWQRDLEVSTDDIGVGLYTDIYFSRLSVGLEYEYGLRTVGDNGTPLDRDEQRWAVSIRKTF
jgi:hypothetical protein